MKKKIPALLAMAMCGFSFSAYALTTQTFELRFDKGPLAGSVAEGSYVFDETFLDDTGSGVLSPLVSEPEFAQQAGIEEEFRGLVDFDVVVDGSTFAIEDDIDFPEFPEITYDGGEAVDFNIVMQLFTDGVFEIVDEERLGPGLTILGLPGAGDELAVAYYPEGLPEEPVLDPPTMMAEGIAIRSAPIVSEPSFGYFILTPVSVPETSATVILMGISLLALSCARPRKNRG